MNAKLKSFSILVLGALLLSIGAMGGCTGSRQVCWSEILTDHHYTATRRTDPNDASKAVWVVEPCKAVTKCWSDKGDPDLVALSPESFKGTLEVTCGAPEDNTVIVTARATAKRTWRMKRLLWARQSSEDAAHAVEYRFTCDKKTGRWHVAMATVELDHGKKVFAEAGVVHVVREHKPKDTTSTVMVKVMGKYGCGSNTGEPLGSQETGDWSTTYVRRHGLVPDSPSK